MIGDLAKAAKANNVAQPGSNKTKKLSSDLRAPSSGSDDVVKVILQLNNKPSGQLNALLNRNGAHVRKIFNNLNMQVVELPLSVAEMLADFDEVEYVGSDFRVALKYLRVANHFWADRVVAVLFAFAL